MGFYDAIRVGASGAADSAFTVDRSLRFNDGDSPGLSRTVSNASNRRTFTISAWVKRSSFSSGHTIFSAGSDGSNLFALYFPSAQLSVTELVSGSQHLEKNSTPLFRDTSAWYHVVGAIDTTQSTAEDRFIVYINGERITAYDANNIVSQNTELLVNSTNTQYVGRMPSGNYFDGYMAEYNFIDGLQLDPSYFAETNLATGQWNPKKYVGSYGTNGFYLNFSDNSGTTATTLGKDTSGNGNNFTPNNFSTYHSVPDTPTNNFCTINPIDKSTDSRLAISEGNLKVFTSHGFRTARATFGLSSGKWYWESRLISWSDSFIGITDTQENISSTTRGGENSNSAMIRQNNGDIRTGGSNSSYGNSQSNGDILGFALDMDNGKFYISENGTFFNSGDPVNGTNAAKTGLTATVCPSASPYDNKSCFFNFGQDDTFDGNETSQGNTDANGLGVFKYAPPSGFLAICSANLPDPTILLPNNHFDTLLYTGNDTTQSITGLEFQPDWVWIKARNTSLLSHGLFDAVRGINKSVFSNSTSAENTGEVFTSFDSNGFSVSDAGGNWTNDSFNYVAWNWNAGDTDGKTYTVTVVSDSGNKYRFDGFGTSAVTLDLAEGGTYIFNYPSAHPLKFSTTADGTHGGGSEYTTGVTHNSSTQVTIVVAASAPTLYYYCSIHSGMGGQVNTNSTLGSSNFDGSRQAITKVNASSGFSIISWTGTGSNLTVGHGLGVAPKVYIVKARTGSSGCDWFVYHKEIGATHNLRLNGTSASGAASDIFNNTEPTSSVLSIGNSSCINENNGTYITYAFSEVAGYSKFGKYTGNGNADGTFVVTGFRPAFLLIKGTHSDLWYIYDNKRNTFNVVDKELNPNNSQSEATFTTVDFLSNGFKIRTSNSSFNYNNYNYIYFAFAESPFKNARAR